jgi:hypothetical protein
MGSATAERFGLGGAPLDGESTLGRLALLIGTQGCALGFPSGGPLGLGALRDAAEGFGLGERAEEWSNETRPGGGCAMIFPGLAPWAFSCRPVGAESACAFVG